MWTSSETDGKPGPTVQPAPGQVLTLSGHQLKKGSETAQHSMEGRGVPGSGQEQRDGDTSTISGCW
ncbi:hypothetical protein PAAG_03015 [Paracoccidioides lutzii Pb01]|uniref:Uncharacterized protein n=1 Tax=Paracoccidioides lutzii (strain ATCC MYA-826 / Pb01) TaxID=502779 RepID=C1GY61_PARBA|nr:hypothetical protein PAAG_03015 [Paracoccidioides lutzii Pb01]EEH41452.2 hypothetical protein PAAG_03015 [Paracoccidioides lutzii Pb01]